MVERHVDISYHPIWSLDVTSTKWVLGCPEVLTTTHYYPFSSQHNYPLVPSKADAKQFAYAVDLKSFAHSFKLWSESCGDGSAGQ